MSGRVSSMYAEGNMMSQRAIAAVVIGLAALMLPSVAAAHPLVAQARQAYEEADFPGAQDALDRAALATDLTREDLIELLELRVLVHFALGDAFSVQGELAELASLAPDHDLGPEASPELRAALAAVVEASPGPMQLDVRVAPGEGAIEILGEARRDPTHLVGQIVVRARNRGGSWQSGVGRISIRFTNGPSAVEYHAFAVGFGGAVLATRGTREAPLLWEPTGGPLGPPGTDWGLIVGVSGAVLGAVLVAVLIGVVASSSGDAPSLTFSPPIVEGW